MPTAHFRRRALSPWRNGALTPYQQVYADFEQYAQTSLERGYVPLSVKDFVRDYFSSLDPSR